MNKTELLNISFEWEALNSCPLCGHAVMIPNGKVSWLNMDFWYVLCPSCGLKFMNPRPTQQSYRLFYRKYFWKQKEKNIGFHQSGQIWGGMVYKWSESREWSREEGVKTLMNKHRELRADMIFDSIAKNITLGPETDILEVGAGYGVTLNEIKNRCESRVYAIEPSTEARKAIRKFSISIIGNYAEDLDGLSRKKQKFDCVIFSHSLENTVYPFDVMTWSKGCLKAGGIIYVQCSNLYTFDQMNPYHPYIFSEHSLNYAGERIGLSSKRIDDNQTHRMLTMIFQESK